MTQDNSGNDRPDLEPDAGSTRYTPSSREGGDETAYDAVYDAEIVDDDPAYRGAHRRDEDDADYDVVYAGGADDAVYDEPYEDAPGERAAGGAEGGLPKRGLAMILIAVAALLALWGIWKLTQDDNDGAGEDAAPTSSTVIGTPAAPAASPSQDPNAQPSQPSQDPNAQATATVTDTVRADEQNAQDPNAQPDQGAEGQPAPAPAPAPAPGGATLEAASAQVYVYNNSGVPDLASRTADQLKGQFNVANDSADAAVMNMPEQVYGVFPETYVFYDPAVPGAEQVAADVAGRVGGTARAKSDIPDGASLPEQANNREAVTVVLAR